MVWSPGSGARVVAMLGHPVAAAHMPRAFNAAMAARGAEALMVPVDVAPEHLGKCLDHLRAWNNCAGAVVTAPHKQGAARGADALSDTAALLGAANLLLRASDGRLTGDNLDGAGFMAALALNGFNAEGRRAVIFGCGGAGGAIALALARAGIAQLRLVDPVPGKAAQLAGMIAEAGQSCRTVIGAPDDLGGVHLAVNASAVGADGRSAVFPADGLGAATLVADVVAGPGLTPWLAQAHARGCKVQTGAEMSDGQLGAVIAALLPSCALPATGG